MWRCNLYLLLFRGKVAVFTVLCEKYQPTLSRDPVYNTYLDKIGQNFFGVPPPENGGGFLSKFIF